MLKTITAFYYSLYWIYVHFLPIYPATDMLVPRYSKNILHSLFLSPDIEGEPLHLRGGMGVDLGVDKVVHGGGGGFLLLHLDLAGIPLAVQGIFQHIPVGAEEVHAGIVIQGEVGDDIILVSLDAHVDLPQMIQVQVQEDAVLFRVLAQLFLLGIDVQVAVGILAGQL